MAAIKGVNVVAPVVPLDTADVHPSHEARYGKGGYRTVATTAERDAIPAPRREAGMLVYVVAGGGSLWQLGADLTTWTQFSSSGGGVSSWNDLTDRPATFPPESHTHALSSLTQSGATTNQVAAWNGTAWAPATVSAGASAWADITGKPSFATVATSGAYGDLTGRPTLGTAASQDSSAFAASSHGASHLAGGGDQLFNQSLNTTDGASFASLSLYGTAAISEENSGPSLAIHSGGGQSYRLLAVGMEYVDGTPYGVIRTYGNNSDVPGVRIESDDGLTALLCKSVAFDDATVQQTAWLGSVDAANVTGLATVATSGAYSSLTGLPTLGTAAAQDSTAFAAASHSHGSVTSDGRIGTTSGQIVVTGTGGALTTASTIASSSVSGLGGAAVLNVGTTAGTVAAGDDARLSDARTPTAHSHAASEITSGVIATARLASSGTASATTFLRGDQTWATVQSGSSSASDLTSGTLANARLTTRARAAINTYLWSSFR